jgi:archaellum component FlaC
MDYNMIVQDEEYAAYAANVVSRTANIEEMLNTMLETMREVVDADGALEGNTADNFATFTETVAQLKGKVEELGNKYKVVADEFITRVDESDQDIY